MPGYYETTPHHAAPKPTHTMKKIILPLVAACGLAASASAASASACKCSPCDCAPCTCSDKAQSCKCDDTGCDKDSGKGAEKKADPKTSTPGK